MGNPFMGGMPEIQEMDVAANTLMMPSSYQVPGILVFKNNVPFTPNRDAYVLHVFLQAHMHPSVLEQLFHVMSEQYRVAMASRKEDAEYKAHDAEKKSENKAPRRKPTNESE